MCLSIARIDERVERISALLNAAKAVTAANEDADPASRYTYAGVSTLLAEIERDVVTFGKELRESSIDHDGC